MKRKKSFAENYALINLTISDALPNFPFTAIERKHDY